MGLFNRLGRVSHLTFLIMKNKYVFPIFLMFFLGVFYASLPYIAVNVGDKLISATSLAITTTALCVTIYFTVETALELRDFNKKKLFSDYCARFSTDTNILKVSEWLLAITEFDSDGEIVSIHSSSMKGNKVVEPSRFEKERFYSFLIELNIQIKNGQIEREDAKKVFSLYARIFNKIVQKDKNLFCCIFCKKSFIELLPKEFANVKNGNQDAENL